MKRIFIIGFFIGVPLLLLLSTPFYFKSARTEPIDQPFQVQWLDDPSFLKTGAQHFAFRCSKCHGNYGKGLGNVPSLIDSQWNYADGSMESIYSIIRNGTPDKSMNGWKYTLLPYDMYAIAQYLVELRSVPLDI